LQEIQSDVESSRIGINKGGKQKTSFNLESETDSRISSRSSSLGSVRKYRQDFEILSENQESAIKIFEHLRDSIAIQLSQQRN
jgi:hypothetical protein